VASACELHDSAGRVRLKATPGTCVGVSVPGFAALYPGYSGWSPLAGHGMALRRAVVASSPGKAEGRTRGCIGISGSRVRCAYQGYAGSIRATPVGGGWERLCRAGVGSLSWRAGRREGIVDANVH